MSEQMAEVLADIRKAALWLASLNGLGAGVCMAWMISVYAEMFPGYASAGGDNCVLARVGAAQVKNAGELGSGFLALAVYALGTVLTPYAIRLVGIFAAEWDGKLAAPISRFWAFVTAFCQMFALIMLVLATHGYFDAVLRAVRGETYITLMEAKQKYETECDAVRQQP